MSISRRPIQSPRFASGRRMSWRLAAAVFRREYCRRALSLSPLSLLGAQAPADKPKSDPACAGGGAGLLVTPLAAELGLMIDRLHLDPPVLETVRFRRVRGGAQSRWRQSDDRRLTAASGVSVPGRHRSCGPSSSGTSPGGRAVGPGYAIRPSVRLSANARIGHDRAKSSPGTATVACWPSVCQPALLTAASKRRCHGSPLAADDGLYDAGQCGAS